MSKKKKLTYRKEELLREAKQFSLYALRPELMSAYVRARFEEFKKKCEIYEKEKGGKI